MAQRCIHKRLTYEDKFARRYYCDHVRLGQLRYEKRHQKKIMRRINKREIDEAIAELKYNSADYMSGK